VEGASDRAAAGRLRIIVHLAQPRSSRRSMPTSSTRSRECGVNDGSNCERDGSC
jgi:hypothetical protein